MATDWLCSLVPDHGDVDHDDGDDDDDDPDNDDDNDVDDDDGDDHHGESHFFSFASMSKCRLGHTLDVQETQVNRSPARRGSIQ